MSNLIIILVLISLTSLSNGARIFGYIPTASYSHQIVFQPLWRELSLRGHQVTVLTTDPINDPTLTNLTEIDLRFSYDIAKNNIGKMIEAQGNLVKSIQIFVDTFNDMISEQLESPVVQKLLKDPNTKFDVCIIEFIMTSTFAFSKKFQCPLIGVTSMSPVEVVYGKMGVPTHPILYPDVLLPFVKPNTLAERIVSVIYSNFMEIATAAYIKPVDDATVTKYFGEEFVAENDNVTMLFVNRNPIIDGPRAMGPSVIEIGGINRIPTKPLPQALKATLDSAKHGFIYFSLGSNVKSKDLSSETLQSLVETFAELPYTVLWKFELETLPNKPDNVIISKWFPQNDVLRHPNIKVFITQGGLQSIEEAIYARVPMIGMPVFADQLANVAKITHKGFGLSLDITSINKDILKKTITEVISNPKYANKVREIAKLAEDQPMSGLQKAVWWVEYVIRHKGAAHFRSPLLDIPWYQYLLLDVIASLTLVLTIIVYIIIFITRFTVRGICKVLRLGKKKKLE